MDCVSYPTSATAFSILAALEAVLLYLMVNTLLSTFHSAKEAPAPLAAFSILLLHMPHSPDTLIVSVFVCAEPIVANSINKVEKNKFLNVFIVFVLIMIEMIRMGMQEHSEEIKTVNLSIV